jgi:universal stress protein E
MSKIVLAVIETDRHPENVAARAAWIAASFGCDLELMLSDPTIGVLRDSFIVSNEAQQIADNIRAAQQKIVDGLAESVAGTGITVSTTVVDERPASDAIIARALEINPAYVVKGTAYHSPAERATFTYTDWRLIRKLDFPLWLVKAADWPEQPVVVAAVDPANPHEQTARLCEAIVTAAKGVASVSSGKLHLLHTYERLVEIGRHAMFAFKPVKLPIEELEENLRSMHREKLDALADAHEMPADAVHQLPGTAQEILPMFARAQGADLVVMGALARSALKRRVVGSTAEKVLDHLPCDILIVRAD